MKREIIERIQELANRNGGKITPDILVTDAMDRRSPLHAEFEWDDKKAAHQHRLDIARALIRSVHVEVRLKTFKVKTPAYIRDPAKPGDEQGYVTVSSLRSDRDLARDAIVAEFSRAAAALVRARNIAAALDFDEHEIDTLREKVVGLSRRVEAAAGSA